MPGPGGPPYPTPEVAMKLTPFHTTLKNGTSVLVREVTQEDRHLLEIGFAHLSDQSKYFRFLGHRKNLTSPELTKFTALNGPDHVAVGAMVVGEPSPEPVAIARYFRLSDESHVAEIAITVVDSYQRQGLGNLLIGVLAKFAEMAGITTFSALVHGENRAMLGLLRHLGGTEASTDGMEMNIRIPITGNTEGRTFSSVDDPFKDARRLASIQ